MCTYICIFLLLSKTSFGWLFVVEFGIKGRGKTM